MEDLSSANFTISVLPNYNNTDTNLNDFGVYPLVELIIILCPALILNILAGVMVISEKSLTKNIRLVLSNVTLGYIIVAIGGIIVDLTAVITSARPTLNTNEGLCRFILWTILTGGAGRLSYMAVFAVIVYTMVRFRKAVLNVYSLLISCILIWIVAAAISSALYSPRVLKVIVFEGATFLSDTSGFESYIFVAIYFLIYCISVYIITITAPIMATCYIRGKIITEDGEIKKALVRYTFFLLIGNTISVIGQVIPILIATFSESNKSKTLDNIIVKLEGALVYVSLLPSPVLIMLYFPAIRQRIKRIVYPCAHCVNLLHSDSTIATQTSSGGPAISS